MNRLLRLLCLVAAVSFASCDNRERVSVDTISDRSFVEQDSDAVRGELCYDFLANDGVRWIFVASTSTSTVSLTRDTRSEQAKDMREVDVDGRRRRQLFQDLIAGGITNLNVMGFGFGSPSQFFSGSVNGRRITNAVYPPEVAAIATSDRYTSRRMQYAITDSLHEIVMAFMTEVRLIDASRGWSRPGIPDGVPAVMDGSLGSSLDGVLPRAPRKE